MEKKKIWIFNHYATNMFLDEGGRHYWFAQKLIEKGYDVKIFCASTVHNSNKNFIENKQLFIEKTINEIPFVFVRTPNYLGNGKLRILNMITFYFNIFEVAKIISKTMLPDTIIASSVHPLTLVAGIKLSRKLKSKCIVEVRDLWPESIVAYGLLERKSILAKILYQGEKWIYRNADKIIMTWPGGKEYIVDQGWDKDINLDKVHHISNGIILEDFDRNSQKYTITDNDLEDNSIFKVVYAGSIRKVNNIEVLVDSFKLIKDKGYEKIKLIVYGDGDERPILERKCLELGLNNVTFKGKIEKKCIPFVLKRADVNILHNTSTSLNKYGQSQNKFFEYLASGKPILQTYSTGYSLYEKFNCGRSIEEQTPKVIADTLIDMYTEKNRTEIYGINARRVVVDYDFNVLTSKIEVLL